MSDQTGGAAAQRVEPTLGEAASEHAEQIQELKATADVAYKGKIIRTRWAACKVEKLDCWPEALALIENGEPMTKVAAFIQEVKAEYLDASRAGLISVLYSWARRNKRSVGERTPVTHVQLMQSNPDRIDPLDALNLLFAIQVDRINEHYVAERRTGNYTKFNTDAIRAATQIAVAMSDIDSRKRKYAAPPASAGTSPNDMMNKVEALKKIYETRYGSTTARVLLNDDSRRKILNAVERIRRGQAGGKLMEILNQNEVRAEELAAKEAERLADDAATIDVDGHETP